MTTITQARETVYQILAAEWSETPFYLDNEGVPDTPDLDDPGPEWIRVVVRNLTSAQETLGRRGNRRFLRPASIAVQIFVEGDTGTDRMGVLVESVKDIFEARRLGPDLITNAITTTEVGPDGAFFQVNVSIALVAFETR